MNLSEFPNLNHLWGTLIIEELRRNGVEYFCVSPGSRSAPLVVPLGLNKKTESFVHFDERGAAFHALGYTSATGKLAALICTSGTAVANFLPAVIEASKKKLPMIILTADRPPELRKSGADQTIEQVGIFGEYVRWQIDLPCPTEEIKPEFVLTTIDQAIHRAQGSLKGPVHINCQFREPLAPIPTGKNFSQYLSALKNWQGQTGPYTNYIQASKNLAPDQTREIATIIKRTKQGLIVVGKLSSKEEQKSVLELAQKFNWPIYPDITSGLRCGHEHPLIIQHFNHFLSVEKFSQKYKPDTVLHLGGRITSKRWYQFIDVLRPQNYIMVLNHPLRNDPVHNVSLRIESGIQDFCRALLPLVLSSTPSSALKSFQETSQRIDEEITNWAKTEPSLNEISVARLISNNIPEDHALFLASSMPIRDFDFFGDKSGAVVPIGSNRGASGIDGTIASAAGFAKGLQKPVTLVIGDLTFLHDLNSLIMLRDLPIPVIAAVINNDGGGIFSFLPIAQSKPTFEKYFGTPHKVHFKSAAELFGLNYYNPSKPEEFLKNYKAALKQKKSSIIEITGKRDENIVHHQKLQKRIETIINKELSVEK